jgi:hypothetical protein
MVSVAYRLPKRQEDDEFDAQQLEKRPMWSEVILQVAIKLDEAIHGNGDGSRVNNHCLELPISRR